MIPKSTISVKSTIFLKGPSEDYINSVQEAVKGDRKPSLCMRKQSVEQMPETPWEPIIVDLVQTNGVISKVRVFRVTHNKVQDFFGQAPGILCKEFSFELHNPSLICNNPRFKPEKYLQ